MFCRKRDERLRRVFEAKVKEEQREEEKKKKIEQKMAQIDEKNDKVCTTFFDFEICVSILKLIQQCCLILDGFPGAASGRGEGQEEGGYEAPRGARAEKEVGRRGEEEEDTTSSETMLF